MAKDSLALVAGQWALYALGVIALGKIIDKAFYLKELISVILAFLGYLFLFLMPFESGPAAAAGVLIFLILPPYIYLIVRGFKMNLGG